MELADRIKRARKMAGLSQVELARRVGLGQSSVHDLESGRSKSLRSSILMPMAQALGQTPEWLVSGHGIIIEPARHSKDESRLFESFNKLSAVDKKFILRMVRALTLGK